MSIKLNYLQRVCIGYCPSDLHLTASIFVLQRTGLIKLRRVLRAIRKHFPQPPDDVLAGNAIDKFLDDSHLCEDKLSEQAGSDGFFDSIMKIIFPNGESIKQSKASSLGRYSSTDCNVYV